MEISIGEDAEDPVLYITDLLIHLSGKQLQKKAAEVIEGEMLDILIGSRPLAELRMIPKGCGKTECAEDFK